MRDATPLAATAAAHGSSTAAVRRIVVNVTSLLTSDVLNRAATFAVYAMVARYCGPHSFGQLSLGLMLLYTFQVFASAGLPTLITREVAKRPRSSGRYFVNASVIASCTSLISLATLYLFATLSRYPYDTIRVISLLGLAVVPWSLTTISEAILRGWERMHLIVLIALPVSAVKIGLSYYLLSTGHGVLAVALVFLGCHCATLLLEWIVVSRHVRLHDASIDLAVCRVMLRRTWRFLGIDGLVAAWGSINAVLLSWFANEAAVGLFVAAWQLLVPVWLALQAVDNSLFPMMCRRAEDNRKRFQQLTVLLLEVLTFVAVPGCVLLYFGAGPIISTVYGNKDFASSVIVLRIMLPVLLLHAAASTFGQVLYSHRREHVTLQIVAVDVVFNVVCGSVLIYSFGLYGAAVTALLTWTLNGILHFAATREQLADESGQRLSWSSTLIVPVVAAGSIMAVAMVTSRHLNFILACVLTSLLYLAVLALLVYAACRGPLGARERFLVPLREH
jgi:O-antigen/teichoic acid export membrane protein